MRPAGSAIELSASDLSWFLGCRQRTALDLAVARGLRRAPVWVDPFLELLRERGLDHERGYVESLAAGGNELVDLSDLSPDEAVAASLESMRAGVTFIQQPALRSERWFGRPDLLRRVETPSSLGPWSYEVVDTKLARETRGGTVLQLCLYTELVRRVQGFLPECFHVVTPDPANPVQTFRVNDFGAYFRLIQAHLAQAAEQDPEALAARNYPEPVEHCSVCRWWKACDTRWRADDHLSLVAGISRLQRRELHAVGVGTLAALATLPLPIPFIPRRGAAETYARVREQARVQLAGRTTGLPVHEILPITAEHGFYHLPAPDPADIFLDLEGDPFAREQGREYLFGFAFAGADGTVSYERHWATGDAEEKAAFETTIDAISRAWSASPGMHVYHYAPYETAAFKRLIGRHATRESEIDRMLRAGLFIDLHAIVKRSLRASVEKYSIKDLEAFYGYRREVALETARPNLNLVERALEIGQAAAITSEVRAAVEGYNRDDCISALALRRWLEELRASVEREGITLPRATHGEAEPSEEVTERERRARELAGALLVGVPVERAERDPDQQARWLLANLIGWHRREEKAPWWEFFRLCDLTPEELLLEKAAIAGLEFRARVGGTLKNPVDRFGYPFQETDVRVEDELHLPDGATFGEVVAFDRVRRTVDVKKRKTHAETYPSAVFAFRMVSGAPLEKAIARIAEDVIAHGISAMGNYRAGRQLLLAEPPRLREGAFQLHAGESAAAFARRIAAELDHTVLAIQGPPGSGKTYTGAEMICDLVEAGKRVGVTAVSHKVVRNLLDAVCKESTKRGSTVRCAQKVSKKSGEETSVLELTENVEASGCLSQRTAAVLGGTAWLWARPELAGSVEVLFVDEAGQMSLANVLAVSQAAESLVLLGDPQQLEQPLQGTHPDGTAVSALEHVIQGEKTMREDRGIFLPETWRLPPTICDFTSEVFYESRLSPRPGTERQRLVRTGPFEGAGLWLVPVPHEGNQNSSLEEVDVITQIFTLITAPEAAWVDFEGETRAISARDVLIVAPYNAQVARLEERLETTGVRVGTVDRFQGQEAPVVIYSMATSSPEDAPRGMEFLYSLNRLNVATSRARCACILVTSPALLEPDCRTPRQMQLANALCRYREMARVVLPESLGTAGE